MTRRTPAQYDWHTCSFDETPLPASPRRSTKPRRQKIQFVVVHHMAMAGRGEAALTACSNAWKTREASAHYGVADGFVRQYVWDDEEAWATANSQGNQAGISIEHANSAGAPGWEVSEATWRTGAKLVAALHHLYGLGRPVDGVTKNHQVVSGTLFKHSDFYATACCGPYLGGKIWAKYVAEAQHQYDLMAGTGEPPKPPATTVETLSDSRINESSAFTFSSAFDDQALTLNDENGVLFTVQPSTGNTIGTYKLPYRLLDPEAARAYAGYYYVLDGGNNDLDRTTMVLLRFPDLGKGNHTLTVDQVDRWVLGFPDDTKRDTESLLVTPGGQLSIMTKGSPNGREFAVPAIALLSKTSTNRLAAGAKVPELISDAAYVRSGKFRVVVQKKRPGVISILKGTEEVHTIPVRKVAQCESIDVAPDGESVTIGSEGAKSPLVTVEIPAAYR